MSRARRFLSLVSVALFLLFGVSWTGSAEARGREPELTELPPGAPLPRAGAPLGGGAGAQAGAGASKDGDRGESAAKDDANGPANAPKDVSAKPPAPTRPADAPIGLPPTTVIPAVPASYVHKDLGWLDLAYPPSASERVEPLIREANAYRETLRAVFGQPVLEHVVVRVAPTFADMTRLAPAEAPPPGYAAGVAYHGLHLVLVSMMAPHGGDAVDVDETFRHELAHVALEDAVANHHVPVWFNEGLAIYLSGENAFDRLRTMWNATLSGTLIPLSDLDRGMPRDHAEVNIAYAESADVVRFFMRQSDQLRFHAMIERVRDGQPFDRAVTEAYGSDLRKLEFQWRSEAERNYSIVPVLTGGGLIWVLVLGILVAAYVRRRRRAKAILARWEREEAIEDALRARIEAEQAAKSGAIEIPLIKVSADVRAAAKVEHHGRWHTLH